MEMCPKLENCAHSGTVNQIRFKNKEYVATCGDDNQLKLFRVNL